MDTGRMFFDQRLMKLKLLAVEMLPMSGHVFQHNSNPKHTSLMVKNYLKKTKVN